MCFALAKAAGHHHWAKEQLCHCPLVSASPVFHYRRDKNVVPYAFIFFSCSLTLLKEQWTTECSVGGTLPMELCLSFPHPHPHLTCTEIRPSGLLGNS